MGQINKGTTYANGDEVNATNLNNHVDNATLAVGAITTQQAATFVNLVDKTLIAQSGALKSATFQHVKDAMTLGDYVARNGTTGTGMVASTQLTLGTTTQLQPLDA